MSNELYACICAEEFPAQALLRLRTDLAIEAVAVLDGKPPLETVCSLNRAARMKGAESGMTRLECETLVGLHRLARSIETEVAAQSVLLECAAQFSPRIEAVQNGTDCGCVLDIAGTERLFGSPEKLANRIKDALATAGFRVSVAVSANFHTARLKASTSRGITIIPKGHEPVALSKLPVEVLELPEEATETLATWGIRTLGELAALPEADTVARLGQQARDWRRLAWGELEHTFQPIQEKFALQEHCAFETAVEEIDSLLFVGARMIDCLATRTAGRALSLAELRVAMRLDGGSVHERTVRPALPTVDRKFLLKLLQLEIAAHPPHAGVLSLTLSAQPGQSSKVQLGLFAPQTPEPSRLDVTLARLKAIAGEDRVGTPVLEDTHKPGSFRMQEFRVETFSPSIGRVHTGDNKDGVAAHASAQPRPGMARCAKAGHFLRPAATLPHQGSLRSLANKRMLVVDRRMEHRRVGCAGGSEYRRCDGLFVSARLHAAAMAAGSCLRLGTCDAADARCSLVMTTLVILRSARGRICGCFYWTAFVLKR